jgi:hypothetical protein
MSNISGKSLAIKYSLQVLHSLSRENGVWFRALRKFPEALCDKEGYIVFNQKEDYLNHSGLRHGPNPKQLHVVGGIKKLSEYRLFK